MAEGIPRPGLLVMLIGEPGAGKTTAMREVFAGYTRTEMRVGECPVMALARTEWAANGLPATAHEIGRDREGHFGGTDALSMGIAPKAQAALRELSGLVVAEGDRLAHDRFLSGCEMDGWAVRVVALATPPAVAAGRREGRGGGQNEVWVKGRQTKTVKLARRWNAALIDGAGTVADIAEQIRGQIFGALKQLDKT